MRPSTVAYLYQLGIDIWVPRGTAVRFQHLTEAKVDVRLARRLNTTVSTRLLKESQSLDDTDYNLSSNVPKLAQPGESRQRTIERAQKILIQRPQVVSRSGEVPQRTSEAQAGKVSTVERLKVRCVRFGDAYVCATDSASSHIRILRAIARSANTEHLPEERISDFHWPPLASRSQDLSEGDMSFEELLNAFAIFYRKDSDGVRTLITIGERAAHLTAVQDDDSNSCIVVDKVPVTADEKKAVWQKILRSIA